MAMWSLFTTAWLYAGLASTTPLTARDYPVEKPLESCPGYRASNVKASLGGLTADLTLAGEACNTFGYDIAHLTLEVSYDTASKLHVKIQDAAQGVYQVPEDILPPPSAKGVDSSESDLRFDYEANPFSFTVSRTKGGDVLFDTSAASLVFQSQYLRLRTRLPANPNLYGLGEHSDPFRLNTTDYIRTLWSHDSYAIPNDANLYGAHPVYFEHRGSSGTHGVFLRNSNGMDVMINKAAESGQYLEYNTLGGVFDFYFVAGPSPTEVSQQYAEIVGLPAMVPYWNFGFHNCRYGYQDAFEVAEVVQNYSRAVIPLEVMWTDIDYMDRRRVFSLDPERFPIQMMQGLVRHLHDNGQKYVVMVDPAVAYQPYGPFERGVEDNVFLLESNGSVYKGVVWPGVTAYPDWFAVNASRYWQDEFKRFFDPQTGVDIDGLWIDMNEPSSFADFGDDPETAAIGYPPEPPAVRTPPRHLPGWPCEFQPNGTGCKRSMGNRKGAVVQAKRQSDQTAAQVNRDLSLDHLVVAKRPAPGQQLGLDGRDLLFPKYAIHNKAAYKDSWNADHGGLSNRTVNTDVIHQNGIAEYDAHNLYGQAMSDQSREAMLARKPDLRPMVITRSTFAGAGAKVGHWLGDNVSSWSQYRWSIRSMMAFASVFQVPVTGSDVCGYASNTTEQLCARWAMLGAFNTFYRNHNNYPPSISQEFYRWDSVAAAARKAIDIRYRLIDYIYTALHRASVDGTPVINPMFYLYPNDQKTFGLELQYFYGDALLVAPVTEENATSVDIYLPDDVFYDWYTGERVVGKGSTITVTDQGLTDIPLYLRGGVIVPVRSKSAMTTNEVREQDFELVVAVGADGTAKGELYLDDGVRLVQEAHTLATFSYAESKLSVDGHFGYGTTLNIAKVTILGFGSVPGYGGADMKRGADRVMVTGEGVSAESEARDGVVSFAVDKPLSEGFEVQLQRA